MLRGGNSPLDPLPHQLRHKMRQGLNMISLQQVTKFYSGDVPALNDISLSIAGGELLALIGPSGSGKSTILSLINRLIAPTTGSILVDGADIARESPTDVRRRAGFVFQHIGLFPHLTVGENIGITPKLLGWTPKDISFRVQELLRLVRLEPSLYALRWPHELSGGQQQRVALARALAARPKIMLMDEPFGALDPLVRDELVAEYRAIHQQLGLTTVLVTHDMSEALLLASRIAVMRGGKIVQSGSAEQLLHAPADDFVRKLIEAPQRRAAELARVFGSRADGS